MRLKLCLIRSRVQSIDTDSCEPFDHSISKRMRRYRCRLEEMNSIFKICVEKRNAGQTCRCVL